MIGVLRQQISNPENAMPLKKYIRAPVEEVGLPSIKGKLAFFENQGRDVVYGAMIPEPDYSDDESEIKKSTNMVVRNNKVNSTKDDDKEQQKPTQTTGNGRLDDKGLIMPKKLVNPCLESSEKKNLHRELMFNQKMGVSVLNQKSELQKAMEKHNDKKVLKEQEKEKKAQLTPFQKALDERAQRLEQMEKQENKEGEKAPSSEFEKIHAKVRAKMEVQ